jgi:hypothetical protein
MLVGAFTSCGRLNSLKDDFIRDVADMFYFESTSEKVDDINGEYPEFEWENEISAEEKVENNTENSTEKDTEKSTDDIIEPDGENNDMIFPKELYARNGNKIIFGSYPQSEVTDSVLRSALDGMAGTLPASSNVHSWSSYGYYINGKEENFMWYKDVSYNGDRYRGVYFTSYRPYSTRGTSLSCQDDSGYILNNTYWFKYEPISWTILSEDTTNKTALILCDMIIDSQEYYMSDIGVRMIDGKAVYPNNYAHSTIRNWLNEEFYNTAFIELQKQIICTTTVYNNAESTGYSNTYACENTEDKIFLLSAQEVTNTVYGFVGNPSSYDIAWQRKFTDYAQVQGVDTIIDGKGDWWLRSANRRYGSYARLIDEEGVVYGTNVILTYNGVVPALQIKL